MGIGLQDTVGVGDHHVVDSCPRRVQHPFLVLLVELAGILQHVHHLLADGEHRVQRCHGRLGDHGGVLPAEFQQLLRVHLEHIAALKQDLGVLAHLDDALVQRAHDHLHGGRLAATRLTHKADLFALVDVQADVIHHLGIAAVCLVPNREVLDI